MSSKLIKDNKGGIFDQIGQLAVGVVVVAIVLVIGFLIMAQAKDQIGDIEGINTANATLCLNSIACNATTTLQNATATLPTWVPLIIIASVGVVLMGLVALFRGRG